MVFIATYKSVVYDLLARIYSAVRSLVGALVHGGPANYHSRGHGFESLCPHDSFKNTRS